MEIANWRDWGRVYQDAALFRPLIEDILDAHGLPRAALEGLTPGTNAVFACGNLVLKLFAPKESSVDPAPVFRAELDAMTAALRMGVPVPEVVASGLHKARYDFYYIVMRRVNAADAKTVLPRMTQRERLGFAQRVRAHVRAMHGLPVAPESGDVYARARENPRWTQSGLPKPFVKAACGQIDRIERLHGGEAVFVHGDLTGENVLIDAAGEMTVIDFADACRAPALYDLAPLYFDLFDCDMQMLMAYMPGHREWDLVEPLVNALCLHEFGPLIITECLCPKAGIPVSDMLSINALRGAVAKTWRP